MHKNIRIISRFDKITGIGHHGWSFITTLACIEGLSIEAVITDFDCCKETIKEIGQYCDKVSFLSEVKGKADFSVYCDVLMQQEDKKLFNLGFINIAYSAFDSSRVPKAWVDTIHKYFDMVIVPDTFVKNAYLNSGLQKDILVLPLTVKTLENRKPTNSKGMITFGFVGSYETRKNVDLLIDSFLEAFSTENVLLHIHLSYSHRSMADLTKLLLRVPKSKVKITTGHISRDEYVELLNSFDCFVSLSSGEGFSLVPREFMHLGKPIILSNSSAHKNIPNLPGILFLDAEIPSPAHYPHIFNGIYGYFESPYKPDVVAAFKSILPQILDMPEFKEMQKYAASFKPENLSITYAKVFNPKTAIESNDEDISPDNALLINNANLLEKYKDLGLQVDNPKFSKHVILANDGGFFSIFNRLVSILVHEVSENNNTLVIPDWRVSAMKEYYGHDNFTSFCYGTPDDGNIFLKLFKPLGFNIPIEFYNDDDFLRTQSILRIDHNEEKEPNLTYTHAYSLYKRKSFPEWRQRYHDYFMKYITLQDELEEYINSFKKTHFENNYIISAHVRHPSHSIEQPGGRIPTPQLFKKIIDREITKATKDQPLPVKIFIASDQDSVISFFKESYGDDMICVNATRSTEEHDAVYNNLTKDSQKQEGFQIQHITASNKTRWSIKMAEEVIVDAWLLAAGNKFVHITSNISTAVSFINPTMEMIYCE